MDSEVKVKEEIVINSKNDHVKEIRDDIEDKRKNNINHDVSLSSCVF